MASKQKQRDAENLESIFVLFGKATLTQLRSSKASRLIPVSYYMKTSFEENGSSSSSLELGYDYKSRLLMMHHIEGFFLKSEETVLCARKLWEAGILQNGEGDNIKNPPFDEIKGEIIEYLLVSIYDFIERYNTVHPTKQQLIEQYYRFKELWTTSLIRYDVTFPLMNFDSDIQQAMSIGSRLQLAPFTSQEKTTIWNEQISRGPLQTMPIPHEKFMIVKFRLTGFRHQQKDSFPFIHAQEIIMEMENVLTALRLFKEGDVGAPVIFEKGYISSWRQMAYYTMLLKEQLIHEMPLPYTLKESDLPLVRNFFEALERLKLRQAREKRHGILTVALRRFNQAYTREIREDQIIDFAIALESCLLAGSKEYAKKEKLSNRGAALLAKTKSPSVIKPLLTDLYMTRNNIVHGGKLLSELGKDTIRFPQRCEEVVRDILKEYVIRIANNTGQTLQTINEDLDKNIVP